MSHAIAILAATIVLCVAGFTVAQETPPAPPSPTDELGGEAAAATEGVTAKTAPAVHWRKDPLLLRRPGSYIGGALGYSQTHGWLEANEDHDDLHYGPLHTLGMSFRVGDCFTEWFSLGFQLNVINAKNDPYQVGAFALLLDSTFYPWRGLGIRPSLGIGMGFAKGKNDWEFGGGGPGCLSFSLLYEFRVLRTFTIAPIAQVFWIAGGEFDGLFTLFGVEFTKWFATSTSN